MQIDTSVTWSNDFSAAPRDKALLVWATDDDGYCWGTAAWYHERGKEPELCWTISEDIGHPVFDGIERGLFWARIPSPGHDLMDEVAGR